ncbi:hypothetical protein [uncultured Jannaschia sp.]|uniref:hypothetical protein n=1 Tax=uncultured Jannaschia sp. TaxID=293347 RepID=UPI0026112E41|nr:hypothetical protein [uncultured Jannaschia sp.]
MSEANDTGRPLRSNTTVTVDNVLRKALRVTDPGNPGQVAEALLKRFGGDAEALRRERAGLPGINRMVAPMSTGPLARSVETREMAEARADIDRDLDALVTESQLKDIEPELRGWAGAIRGAARAGLASGALALGAGERDRAFAARRILTDYARLARYLAAMTGCVPGLFCRLAQSCDNMGALILVKAGEALASGGVTSTSIILQSASAELQTRREAVLAALRNLEASKQDAHSQGGWPRGLTALRQLHQALENQGATELRAFLDEGYLGNTFDEMISLASGQTSDAMRALGATSVVVTAQLERFVRVASGVASPQSPPLTNFLAAIQYFIEGFGAARSGHRLVFIARPPLLFYGLYGSSQPDGITDLLLQVIRFRGQFAEALDCLCCCSCEGDVTRALLIGSKTLYDIDRSIDVLAQAPSGLSDSLLTAAAFEFVILAAHDQLDRIPCVRDAGLSLVAPLSGIAESADRFRQGQGFPYFDNSVAAHVAAARSVDEVLCSQLRSERQWEDIVRNMSNRCNHRHFGLNGGKPVVRDLIDAARERLRCVTKGVEYEPCRDVDISIPRDLEVTMEDFAHNVASSGRL